MVVSTPFPATLHACNMKPALCMLSSSGVHVHHFETLSHQAGFESPAVEVEKRVSEQAQTSETVKELLGRIQHLTSPDYFAALTEALVAAEAETNSTVTTDGSSAGYKKFAEKVKVRAVSCCILESCLKTSSTQPHKKAVANAYRSLQHLATMFMQDSQGTMLFKHAHRCLAQFSD